MMIKIFFRILITPVLILLLAQTAKSQIREITFGEIPKEDLEMEEYSPDPSADAVILENHAWVRMTTGEKILVVTDCHVRIKIINTDGLDYANVEIPYGGDEKVIRLKAASYNMEDEVIIQNMVDKKSFYYDKTSRYRNTLRFSVPNVKPGTVIEYSYTLESPDFFSLYTFTFQKEIPVRRCNFHLEFPGYFEYKFVTGGSFHNVIYRNEEKRIQFGRSYVDGFTGTWIGNDIPAYNEEPFSAGSDDYYTHVGFELSKINIPGYYFEDVSPTYPRLSEKLLDRSDFGGYFANSAVIRMKTEEMKAQGGTETDLLRRIFTFVSGYMMWNGYSDFTASASMSKIYKDARGSAADINLMLLAMLRTAGLKADPVILSTRENGLLNPLFAINSKFNHVVVAAVADSKRYIIDATDPVRPFNMLPEECLNGQGWLVDTGGGSWVDLTNGEHYGKTVDIEMSLNENGSLTGTATGNYVSYNAWQVRKICSLQGTEAYRDYIQSVNSSWKISTLQLENLQNLEEPVIEKINMTVPDAADSGNGVMYFNPVINGRIESNEFYAGERLSPIDMACPSVKKYSCSVTIPDGWAIAELPQSVNIRMEGGGAAFIYNIRAEGRTVKLDSEISFSDYKYPPERYASIRNFYSNIIRKQSEVVILRKEI